MKVAYFAESPADQAADISVLERLFPYGFGSLMHKLGEW